MDIKKEDMVTVILGDDKGKRGSILSVSPKKGRCVVERLNMIKRHMKPSKKYTQGGIIEKEAPIHRSNLMLVCPKCDKPTKIGHKFLESGSKVRVCRKCGEVLD
ncbi:MAG TPA: 50S ribosomal protein L24 [Nitrospirae bacterium]|nr:50S ribosomal protein L24 [Nitrospirota bacterium]HDK17779.1 50S ribosomal protein L24 [Nitrospirota bacterium]HDK41168.1 50S ribosomal protein L24 [Nitrospirota bacterium]